MQRASNGFTPLRLLSKAAALPYTVIMLFMCYSLTKALRVDLAGAVIMPKQDQMTL